MLFAQKVDSVIGVITNSSSELFVGINKSKEVLEELIESIYPDYLNEYYPLKTVKETNDEEFDSFLHFLMRNVGDSGKRQFIMSFCEKKEIDAHKFVRNLKKEKEEIEKWGWWWPSFNWDCFDEVRHKVDPENKYLLLFSKGDNPNWEMQERLEEIMERYHLG